MNIDALYVAIGLIVAFVVVLGMSLSNRIGGEPRRSWLARSRVAPTPAPSDSPTDPFADDTSFATDPNFTAVRSNTNEARNFNAHM